MTTFINNCGCKITIDEDIKDIKELTGNSKHLIGTGEGWRILEDSEVKK
jgi:hypothetical protein